jgi:outer membrane protein TolC
LGLLCAGALVGLTGCAAIEFSHAPAVPDLRVQPSAAKEDHPSPPPLPGKEEKKEEKKEVAAPQAEPAKAPLRLTVEAAIAMALENNQALQVQEINPALAATNIAQQRAAFDPALAGAFTRTRNKIDRSTALAVPITVPNPDGTTRTVGTTTREVDTSTTTLSSVTDLGLDEFLPTGTSIGVTVTPSSSSLNQGSSNRHLAGAGNDTSDDTHFVQLSITQSLLRGAGLGVNLASLRQARLAYLSSEYDLRGFAESLVAQVENAYWDYYLSQRQIDIFQRSLELAQAQETEVEARIEVGKVAESERAAAQAEVAQRRSLLINARSTMAQARLALLRLLNPSEDALRSADVELISEPLMPEVRLDEIEDSVKLAQQMRPELNQARLLIQQDELQLVKTRNGLLPQLDVFLTLSQEVGTTGYGSSFQSETRALEDDTTRTDAGIRFSYPIGNRAARAVHQRALFTREQDLEALKNLQQLVEQDVRGAFIELNRAREQVTATEATRKLQEITAQTEQEKFRVGKSTALLVAQAQRDLLSAQIDEVQSSTAFLQAVVNLYYRDGSLLLRRGVSAPGIDPVELKGIS